MYIAKIFTPEELKLTEEEVEFIEETSMGMLDIYFEEFLNIRKDALEERDEVLEAIGWKIFATNQVQEGDNVMIKFQDRYPDFISIQNL